jgi:Nucleotidyl transferase AbiEii toxin, Type IV TA system
MLYWNTVSPILKDSLLLFMQGKAFSDFRLVGGTALSLYKGHRMSVDIDLFTDAQYGSIDFDAIDRFLQKHFPYVDTSFGILQGRAEKDFWDLHELLTDYSLKEMLLLHKRRACLRGKYWEFIKEDFEEWIAKGE